MPDTSRAQKGKNPVATLSGSSVILTASDSCEYNKQGVPDSKTALHSSGDATRDSSISRNYNCPSFIDHSTVDAGIYNAGPSYILAHQLIIWASGGGRYSIALVGFASKMELKGPFRQNFINGSSLDLTTPEFDLNNYTTTSTVISGVMAKNNLAAARYGKDNIRLCKVYRDQETGVQSVVDMTICAMLEGEIGASYTKADNSHIVATDSIKNTIFILAKKHPVFTPEVFGSIVGTHFIEKYRHIHSAHVDITIHRWTRLTIDGKPHPHSFLRDGAETRNVKVDVTEGKGIEITSNILGMLLLKSTGAHFWGYIKDEFTTQQDTYDRILSTEVDATWRWKHFDSLDDIKSDTARFDNAWTAARDITIKTFAEHDSPSVQATMYTMAEKILAAVPEVESVDYALPNKHYFEIDLSFYQGMKNLGKDAEVYVPQWGNNGLLKCTVTRPVSSEL